MGFGSSVCTASDFLEDALVMCFGVFDFAIVHVTTANGSAVFPGLKMFVLWNGSTSCRLVCAR